MTDQEKREWLSDLFNCEPSRINSEDFARVVALIARIEAETRAAVLAEEERRVWMEAYACYVGIVDDATSYADAYLARWREARTAW